MNGSDEPQEINLTPYREVLPAASATDFLSGRTVELGEKLSLEPRESLLFCF